MLKPLKKISGIVKFTNKWWDYIVDKYILPNGNEAEYHYVHTPGSVFIVPICDDGKIMMISQYRYLNQKISLELPGGGMKVGLTQEECAHNELIEETGHDGELEYAGYFNPFSGITDELCYVYVARKLLPSDKSLPDESEEIEVVRLTKNEIESKVATNEIYSGMTLASWIMAKDKI
jgi:ADP-ribose pyrophosphatase